MQKLKLISLENGSTLRVTIKKKSNSCSAGYDQRRKGAETYNYYEGGDRRICGDTTEVSSNDLFERRFVGIYKCEGGCGNYNPNDSHNTCGYRRREGKAPVDCESEYEGYNSFNYGGGKRASPYNYGIGC